MADRETAEVTAQVNEKLEELSRMLQYTKQGFSDTASSSAKLNAKFHLATQAASGLTKAFTEGASAMYRGEKGMKAFNSSVDAGADALIALAGALALLGGPVTLLAAGLTAAVAAGAKYVKATNEQSDNLYKAFQGLSRAGAVGSDGLQSLYVDMQKLGLGVQDLDTMVALVSANSKDLALFAGSVNEGRKQFSNVGASLGKFTVSLFNAGMTQDEINEASMGYLRLQSRIGQTQKKTTEEIAESTHKYLLEQDALTKLTGMTRKEQEDAREEIRSQEMFAAKLEQLRQQGRADEAKALEDTYLVLRSTSKNAAQGFADISTGNLRTEAAQKEMRASQGESMRVAQQISAGQLNAAEAADKVAAAHGRTADAMGATQGLIGNYNKTYGNLSEDIALRSKMLSGGFADAAKKIADEQKKQGVVDGKALDAEQQRQSELRKTQQDTMKATQDFVRAGVEPATKATAAFAGALNTVTNKILPGAGTSGVVGGTAPSAGKTTTPSTAGGGFFGFGRPGAASPVSGQADLETMGLRIKQGDVQAEGSKVSPKLIEIAKKIQETLPDFGYFSGFNDKFHQERAPGSQHTKGLAADFTLASPPSKERGAEIISMLKGLGASYVADEYNNPSSNATAGHIHLQIPEFETGGLATGPNSGYMAKLHGTEAVIPLNNDQGNFVELFEEIADNSRTTTMLLEELVRSQKNSVDVQQKILRVQT